MSSGTSPAPGQSRHARILSAEFSEKKEKELVLLVDDSRVVRKMISAHLSPKFECVEAGSFDEAISELRTREFGVVITDIIMPGLSGIELLRKIIRDFADTAVIVVSGVDRPQRALDAMRLGAFDYLIKPFEIDVLELTVERAFERRTLLLNSRRYKRDLEMRNIELVRNKEQVERLQAQVVQHEKMASLGQLSAGIAHELNNPVGFVYANLEMLDRFVGDLVRLIKALDQTDGSVSAADVSLVKQQIGYPQIIDEVDSMLRDCRDGSVRIRDIVQNLRTFSRLDEAEYTETDIHEGLDATIRLLSVYFASGNVTLRREYGDIPRAGVFAGQLNQVWMNLLANAAQAIGPNKGEITIVTTADDENTFVEIMDTGSGIAIQDLNHVFDPFYTTKTVGEGTGLGLSISFGIIERHGGTITVNSRLGKGTTFKVSLPRDFNPNFSHNEKSIACYSEHSTSINNYETQNPYR